MYTSKESWAECTTTQLMGCPGNICQYVKWRTGILVLPPSTVVGANLPFSCKFMIPNRM